MPPGSWPVRRVGEIGIDIAAGHRPQRQRDAVIDRAGGDRRDDRLQPAIDDDQPVDRAAEQAHEQEPPQRREPSRRVTPRPCRRPGNW